MPRSSSGFTLKRPARHGRTRGALASAFASHHQSRVRQLELLGGKMSSAHVRLAVPSEPRVMCIERCV